MNKKKKIIGVAAVLAVCLAIAIPVGRWKFNFDDKFKIAENFKANSSKNDAENGKSGDTNNIDGNIGSDSSKDSVSDGKNQDSNSPNGNNDSGSNINNNGTDQNNVGNQNNVGGNSNSGSQNTGGVSGDGSITDFDNTGATAAQFNGLMSVNELGKFIWENYEKASNEDELLKFVLDEYEVDEDVAKTDLDEFLAVLRENEII